MRPLEAIPILAALATLGFATAAPAETLENRARTLMDRRAELVDMQDFNECKRDAYVYGVMGSFRRLFILSCLTADMTPTSQVRLD